MITVTDGSLQTLFFLLQSDPTGICGAAQCNTEFWAGHTFIRWGSHIHPLDRGMWKHPPRVLWGQVMVMQGTTILTLNPKPQIINPPHTLQVGAGHGDAEHDYINPKP